MKLKACCLLLACLLNIYLYAQKDAVYPIIPRPVKITALPDSFRFPEQATIICHPNAQAEAGYLKAYLESRYGISVTVKKDTARLVAGSSDRFIYLCSTGTASADHLTTDESYSLDVSPGQIRIFSLQPAGTFYGIQSLIQMLPATAGLPSLACVRILDRPAYPWRGMHLDCCRHFFTKEEVKRYIDYLALYKLNTFHWHLTDDQGWRIEIKRYPKLTGIGAVRKQTLVGRPSENNTYDGISYGGFYTQEDIREVVRYATVRHVTIVPEIEMPGHALAALAAYPQYSCKGGPFEVGDTWGVYEDVFCAGNDSTFTFLKNVLTEVCNLFPGKLIHIGGDECPKDRWKTCPKCQARMKGKGLKDEHALQSYFITRIEAFLNKKGKQIIGWDEILEGGLAPNATVMSWRGAEGGIEAARLRHKAVMSPGRPCYFDHYQVKNISTEPLAIGGFNPLDSVYHYNPRPAVLNDDEKQYILGAQGNVWSEYLPSFRNVEYMSLPRMAALSEALWTQDDRKSYPDFIVRLKRHALLLDQLGVNYARHFLKQDNE